MKAFNLIMAAGLCAALLGCSNNQRNTSYYEQGPRPIVSDESTTVATKYGKLQGYLDGNIYTFKGIQYAKAERFMPPTEPDMIEGVKMARHLGPRCPQAGSSLDFKPKSSDSEFGFQGLLEPVDEHECLVLNVWTKGINDGKKRPVFLWIHGGGFATGSASDLQCYDGGSLADKGDIVVVSVNHRLNILGYLDLRGLGGKYSESVNLGMQDLVKALEWINGNISAFGGDPGNVTIAGQSGGGGKVNALMAMPSAMGLFHKAIAESGSWILHTEDNVGKALGMDVIGELGLKPSEADKLDEIPYSELVAAGSKALRKAGLQMFCPTVDGIYVTDPSFDMDAPTISQHIPMIIGSNQNEFSYDNKNVMTDDEVMSALRDMVGADDADSYLADYRKAYPNGRLQDVLYTDLFLRKKAVDMADAKSAIGSDVYVYLFAWKPVSNSLGAVHGMEMPFMFNNVIAQREMTGGTAEAMALGEKVSSAWIAFMKTGDPNVKGLPRWEKYTKDNGYTMVFDNECSIVRNHDRDLLNNHKATMHF